MTPCIGTSGFQYPEWRGLFYPAALPVSKMLAYYAGHFDTTEVNYTFRRLPSEKTLSAWRAATPENFIFSFKAPQRITHFAKLRDCGEQVAAFFSSLAPMGDRTGAVLFQLPPTLMADPVLLADFLHALPKGPRAAMEFRHPSWLADPIYELLSSADVALCLAESEELAVPRVRTASFGYLRLRRDDYSKKRLEDWADFLRSQERHWTRTFLYFKHEERCLGPRFAKLLRPMIAGAEAR